MAPRPPGLAHWMCDRLYEFGYGDLAHLPGGPLPTTEFAEWLALAACAAFVNGIGVGEAFTPIAERYGSGIPVFH